MMRSETLRADRAVLTRWTVSVVTATVCATAAAACTPQTSPDPSATTPPSPTAGSPFPTQHAPSGDARAELAARAAAAQDLAAVAVYAYETGGQPERTVMAVRAPDGTWRVDVSSWALDATVDVAVLADADEQQYHCGLAPPPDGTTCVPVSDIPAGSDPRVQYLFTDWLEVFTDRSAAISVAFADPPVEEVAAVAHGPGECFSVQPSAASLVVPVDAGTYCYRADGTLTGVVSGLGTLVLTDVDEESPETVTTPGPVLPDADPLPAESPEPATPSAPGSPGSGTPGSGTPASG